MRIAFHAPMKPPGDARPSGDRTVARGLIAGMRMAGHGVEIASRFTSYDRGDPVHQSRLERRAARLTDRIVQRAVAADGSRRYDLWFTYHLYHKAPDLLGPAVSRALDIPYVVAEASVADKQAGGPWDRGYRSSIEALKAADLLIGLNPADTAGVERHRPASTPLLMLPPFLDTRPYVSAVKNRNAARADLGAQHGFDPKRPLLLTAAMMRFDQKLCSYRLLAEALSRLREHDFTLLVVGDGPARSDVETALRPLGERVAFHGAVTPAEMPAVHAACDIFVWPAIKEAFGMALLEAQAAGLPVVAGRSDGVAGVVADGRTGLLTCQGDAAGFAEAVRSLLVDEARREAFSVAASAEVAARHDLAGASHALDTALRGTLERHRRDRTGDASPRPASIPNPHAAGAP